MTAARRLAALAAAAVAAATLSAVPAARAAAPPPLVNLAHLDFLRTAVTPPAQVGHTTYQLAERPSIGVLWTYADHQADGGYRRIGGGRYDPATNTYSQGAYNADDISRAAVVYVRHWRQYGDAHSRDAAAGLLRGLAYLQTAAGPDAGNVVLWMQPDGTLHPSADPKDSPDPSDSGPSFWLSRTIWALGEGYAAFRGHDPGLAGFLRDRLDLALGALERQVLVRYGQWKAVDGARVPAWLVVDDAGASAEATLGLVAYARAGGGDRPRRDARELAEGIAALSAGDAGQWPYGAVLPWALSRSDWHAWGAQMPAALAGAANLLHRPDLAAPAATDAAVFTPELLAAGGADNGWLPAPVDTTQIAYGVDARLQSLLAVADLTGRPALRGVAAVAAAWYFGANRAGTPMYDPATGVTYDGLAGDGTVNRNSGAESTIHGLLSMLALDAHPDVAAVARGLTGVRSGVGITVVEAEAGGLAGGAAAVRPSSPWTGESQYSGGAYVSLPAGSSVTLAVPAAAEPRLAAPVLDLRPDAGTAATTWTAGDRTLGRLAAAGPAQGDSPAPGLLLPVTLPAGIGAGAGTVTATATGGTARVDALLLDPAVSQVALAGDGGAGAVLLHGSAAAAGTRTVTVPGTGQVTVVVADSAGRTVRGWSATGPAVTVPVLPGGFTVLTRR